MNRYLLQEYVALSGQKISLCIVEAASINEVIERFGITTPRSELSDVLTLGTMVVKKRRCLIGIEKIDTLQSQQELVERIKYFEKIQKETDKLFGK